MMELKRFLQEAENTHLTQKQAEALFRTEVMDQSRQQAADEMDTSPSNLDNLLRAAQDNVAKAANTLKLGNIVDFL